MNCRRTQSLLSAYIDSELTGHEMLAIRGHLSRCGECRAEHEALVSVKRMLSMLPEKAPRTAFVVSLSEVGARRGFESVVLHFLSRRLGLPVEWRVGLVSPGGRRLASACALGLVGAWFIVAPTANSPYAASQSANVGGEMPPASPVAWMRWHSATLNPPVVDPIAQPVMLQAGGTHWFQQRMLGQTRRRAAGLLALSSFGGGASVDSRPISVSNLVYSGYSIASAR